MKVYQLFEDAKGPLVWSLIRKILRSGGRVEAYITTWDHELAKNMPPAYYIITAATFEYDKFQKNDSYRLYFKDASFSFSSWFEVMDGDDSEMKLTRQEDGSYRLVQKDGTPITA